MYCTLIFFYLNKKTKFVNILVIFFTVGKLSIYHIIISNILYIFMITYIIEQVRIQDIIDGYEYGLKFQKNWKNFGKKLFFPKAPEYIAKLEIIKIIYFSKN